MLPKNKRLKGKKEFDFTFKNGDHYGDEIFTAKILKRKDNEFKIGIVAPVKKFKKATERNKIKRIMREAAKNIDFKGVNVIFIAKEKVIGKEIDDIKKRMESILLNFKSKKK